MITESLSLEQMREKLAVAQALLDEIFEALPGAFSALPTGTLADDDGHGGLDSAGSPSAGSGVPAAAGTLVQPTRPMRVALIVGHSPRDGGAINPETRESEYAYNSPLALQIADRVTQETGGRIVVSVMNRGDKGIAGLVQMVNEAGVDFAIEMHANASDGTGNGTEMIYLEASPEAKLLAGALQSRVVEKLGLKNRGIKNPWAGRGEALLRGTRMPCVIAEPFFIDHMRDYSVATLQKVQLREAYAAAILDYARSRWERGLWV